VALTLAMTRYTDKEGQKRVAFRVLADTYRLLVTASTIAVDYVGRSQCVCCRDNLKKVGK